MQDNLLDFAKKVHSCYQWPQFQSANQLDSLEVFNLQVRVLDLKSSEVSEEMLSFFVRIIKEVFIFQDRQRIQIIHYEGQKQNYEDQHIWIILGLLKGKLYFSVVDFLKRTILTDIHHSHLVSAIHTNAKFNLSLFKIYRLQLEHKSDSTILRQILIYTLMYKKRVQRQVLQSEVIAGYQIFKAFYESLQYLRQVNSNQNYVYSIVESIFLNKPIKQMLFRHLFSAYQIFMLNKQTGGQPLKLTKKDTYDQTKTIPKYQQQIKLLKQQNMNLKTLVRTLKHEQKNIRQYQIKNNHLLSQNKQFISQKQSLKKDFKILNQKIYDLKEANNKLNELLRNTNSNSFDLEKNINENQRLKSQLKKINKQNQLKYKLLQQKMMISLLQVKQIIKSHSSFEQISQLKKQKMSLQDDKCFLQVQFKGQKELIEKLQRQWLNEKIKKEECRSQIQKLQQVLSQKLKEQYVYIDYGKI